MPNDAVGDLLLGHPYHYLKGGAVIQVVVYSNRGPGAGSGLVLVRGCRPGALDLG